MPPLTIKDVQKHPAFKDIVWDLTPQPKIKPQLAASQARRVRIAYEIHGEGPIRIVWINGLGALKSFWQRQTQDFGHKKGKKYSCLIFDNRGMGGSDKPLKLYSTGEMAKDTLTLLDDVGWTTKVHVVGISMGGMIAQQMALMDLDRVASLTLVSTAAKIENTGSFLEKLRNNIKLVRPSSLDARIAEVKSRVNIAWLDAPDEQGEFPTNGDRFTAEEMVKRKKGSGWTKRGFFCQLSAAASHCLSPQQINEIGDRVGQKNILVIHGTDDPLITLPHAEVLVKELGGEESGVTKKIFPKGKHYLPLEERSEFGQQIERLIERAEAAK